MVTKILSTIVTVLMGVGLGVLVFFVLDRLASLLPSRLERRLKPYAYLLPAYAAIAFYLIYPSILTVIYSFKNAYGTAWVGLSNYKGLLDNSAFRATLFNTLLWMIVVPVVCVVLGLVIAVLADRLKPGAENLSKTIIFMPMAISMVGASTVWKFLYDYQVNGQKQIGLQNAIVTALGGHPVTWLQNDNFRFNTFLLMVILVWAQAGYSMVLLSSAIKGVPTETIEAARIDGASEFQAFTHVVVPQVRSTMIVVWVTTLITVMKIFDVVYVMTDGNFNTNVIGVQFFNSLFTDNDQGTAAAIVVLLMIATIPIIIFQLRQFKRQEAEA